MRFSIASSSLFLLAGVANAASKWSFSDAQVSVSSKKSTPNTETFTDKQLVKNALVLGQADTIKVSLTTTEDSKPKRPHQAFLVLKEASGLEAPYPLTVKTSGKAQVEITQKDLPVQLLLAGVPLKASLVLGSFGSTEASVTPVFDIDVQLNPNAPVPEYKTPVRYGRQPEIHHIFRDDPKSPPKIVSFAFVVAIVVAVNALILGWFVEGANLNHLPKALNAAPISHVTFFGSIAAIEGTFFLYYSSWNLFQTLPVIAALSIVAFLSGTKALSEVQSRRLAGER